MAQCPPCECDVATDNFTRANETPLASPWTKLSGNDANLTSNRVVKAAGTGCSYQHNTAYPGAASESRYAAIKVKIPSPGGTVKVRVGQTDDDNYYAAVLLIPSSGCPVLSACARVAGSGCGIGAAGPGVCAPGPGVAGCINVPTAAADEWGYLEVCLKPNSGGYSYPTYDSVCAKLTTGIGTANKKEYATTVLVDGPAVGAYAGWDSTDAAEIDDFTHGHYRDSPAGQNACCLNCKTPCLVGSDPMTTDQPCLWWDVTGTHDETGGSMEIPAVGLIQFALPHPSGKTAKRVLGDIQWEAGNIIRIDLGTGYVLFDVDAGTMRIYDDTDVELDSASGLPAADDAWYPVEVCYHSGALTVTAFGECLSQLSADTGDVFVYLGCDAGTAHFRNFFFYKHHDSGEPDDLKCERCNCPVTCGACENNTAPAVFLVTLSGGVAGFCTGFDCSAIDGMTWAADLDTSNPLTCVWGNNQFDDPIFDGAVNGACPADTDCDAPSNNWNCYTHIAVTEVSITLNKNTGSGMLEITVDIFITGFAGIHTAAVGYIEFYGEIPLPVDCTTLSVTLDYVSWNGLGAAFQVPWDWSAATVLLEAM